MRRALTCATAYFLTLFTLGFFLGVIRVTIIAPRIGEFAATLAEVPVMLTAAFFLCRWAIRRWRVPRRTTTRRAMVGWFLILLVLFETLLGRLVFGLRLADQWDALTTPAGLVGLCAQISAALFPVFVGERDVYGKIRPLQAAR
jgi:hypothetical protein